MTTQPIPLSKSDLQELNKTLQMFFTTTCRTTGKVADKIWQKFVLSSVVITLSFEQVAVYWENRVAPVLNKYSHEDCMIILNRAFTQKFILQKAEPQLREMMIDALWQSRVPESEHPTKIGTTAIEAFLGICPPSSSI